MPASPAERFARDVAACTDILRAGSKTFHAASRLLPARVRAPASVLYAFCRVADDAVDVERAGETAVERLRQRLDRAYAGSPFDRPVDRALTWVLERHQIPRAVPLALLEGLSWDARGRRYATFDELTGYAARVASTVGVMMTLVMGRRERDVLSRASDLGVAMQLTNIARDVGEDARAGRLYLPLDWLDAVGLDPRALLARPSLDVALAAVVDRLLAEADRLYARGDEGVGALPRDCRVAIRAARLIYAAIGDEVRRAGYDSVTRRAVVPGWRKALLLARSFGAFFWPSRPAAPGPTAEGARFLIDAVAGPEEPDGGAVAS